MKNTFLKITSLIVIMCYLLGSSVFPHLMMIGGSHETMSDHTMMTMSSTTNCHTTTSIDCTKDCLSLVKNMTSFVVLHKSIEYQIVAFSGFPYTIDHTIITLSSEIIKENHQRYIPPDQKFLSYGDLVGITLSLS